MTKPVLFVALLLAGCASGGIGDTESSPAESDARESPPRLANRAFFERLMDFRPARYDGKPVGVKIAFTVTFRTGDGWT